jgi:hypothetical protein
MGGVLGECCRAEIKPSEPDPDNAGVGNHSDSSCLDKQIVH